jgi:hypothetical protein
VKTNQTTKAFMATFPGFHDLPKGIRQMLLVSESHFFAESSPRPTQLPAHLPPSPLPIQQFVAPPTSTVRAG